MQSIIQSRPGTGYYAAMRNKSRREYHKAVNYINKHRDLIKRVNFMNTSLESDKDIFKEIRKLKAGKSTLPNNIDGCSDSEGIVNVFSAKYSALYNLSESNTNSFEYNDIIHAIDERVNSESGEDLCSVSTEEVIKAINKLKSNKSHGLSKLSSNCFKEAPFSLIEHFSVLFSLTKAERFCRKFGNCSNIV